ncbi:MAG: hypothetical protein HRT45_00310 [Bdellovibrionales bacterium]|nr:hypothetical protein [Bdellovibrionales bacterium]
MLFFFVTIFGFSVTGLAQDKKQPTTEGGTELTEPEAQPEVKAGRAIEKWYKRKQFMIAGGTGYYYGRHPSGYDFSAVRNLSIGGVGTMPLFPILSNAMRLQWSATNGNGRYKYESGDGNKYSENNADFTINTLSLDFGIRLDPFCVFMFQPFGELGMVLGGHSVRFDRSIESDLRPTGSDYELDNTLFTGGYYTIVGLQAMIDKRVGLSFFWRYSRIFSSNARVISDHFTLVTDHYNIALVFNY